ncbi:MAG: MMPL family transporter [Oscillospiraceae bacterium]
MQKFGHAVVKHRKLIIILSLILLIPSVFGMFSTRINYDMLDYLPKDMDTAKGQEILLNDFGKGAFSFVIVEGMDTKDVVTLKKNIEKVDHVDSVIWYDDVFSPSVPMEMLPQKYYNAFNSGDATMMAVFFDTSTSADETMDAISQIRSISGKQCYVSGMSALVTDLKAMCEREEPIYVGIAVICACLAMLLLLDSWLAPFVFLASIGITILYNMGTNFFLGEISYITKALAAVLQLAVTMDYSIFLWHSYTDEKQICETKETAMVQAINRTIISVIGSSATTIAGFIALCFMSYTMGMDLGIVMAKGVLLGVIGSVTILPTMILMLDKPLTKTRHRALIPKADRFSAFITKHSWVFLVLFVIIAIPATIGYLHTPIYYDFTNILTSDDMSSIDQDDMQFLAANKKLTEDFNVASTHMIIMDSKVPSKDVKKMINEIDAVNGVSYTLGLDSVLGNDIPRDMVPSSIANDLSSDKYQLLLINSTYKVSTDECNEQIDAINAIIKTYDENAMLIGEAPCTKDLIEVTNKDFNVVNIISILAIFVILAIVLKSYSLPFILVLVIEFAIFTNLGIPYFTNFSLPFIAPICISTIQLGATVDYAILMTTRYREERMGGLDKHAAVTKALTVAIPSVLVSALGFFAATFGVGLYSNVSLISSMCNLMARGALISMLSVIFILPSLLLLLDKIICKTTWLCGHELGNL